MFNFKKGQDLEIAVKPKRLNDINGIVRKRITVEEVYSNFILCKGKNYKECFLISSFENKEIVVTREFAKKNKADKKAEGFRLGVFPIGLGNMAKQNSN